MFGEIGQLEMAVKGVELGDGAKGGGVNKACRVAVEAVLSRRIFFF